MNKKNVIILSLVLVVTITCVIIAIVASRNKTISNNNKEIKNELYNYFYEDFLQLIVDAKYDIAYSHLSWKSKAEKFVDSISLADYCIYNFIAENGDIRDMKIDGYEKLSDNEYQVHIIVGNKEGDKIGAKKGIDDFAVVDVRKHDLLITLDDANNSYFVEFK